MKRTDWVINWNEYFMGIALLSAQRSKDPRTQTWCCLVNPKQRIVWIWYNWFPKWCDDDLFPWWKSKDPLDDKNSYVVHAEINAILNSTQPLDDCTMFVTLHPCDKCFQAVIQSWIKRVIYLADRELPFVSVVQKMAASSWVELIKMNPLKPKIELDFEENSKTR